MNKIFDFMDEDRKSFLKVKHDEAKRFIDPLTGKIYSEMVERINCPVCDVDNSSYVFSKNGFDFVKCSHCTLLHVNPQLKSSVQDEIYKTSKTADRWIQLQKKHGEQIWNAEKKYIPALQALKELKPHCGRMLDVGCSTGQFLDLARTEGWEVEGVELNTDACRLANEKYQLKVHNTKLEHVGFPDESFDIITLWGVFEHLTDPNSMLENVHKLLKPHGLVLLFVPNGHSLIIRMTREHNSTVSGRAHLWYFTPGTMTKMLEKHGFAKEHEFSILPQIHEIEHFLQQNILYQEPTTKGEEEFKITEPVRKVLEDHINQQKLGYKLITIGRKTG